MWLRDAWIIRGDAYASKVPASAWTSFHERVDKANAYLLGAAATDDPHLPYLKIDNAKAQGSPRSRIDSLYDSAIQRFPTYFHYYSQRAVILQVRWLGKDGELSSYAQSLLARPGGDPGLVAYSYVANVLMDFYERSSLLNETDLRWPSIKAAYSTRLKLYGLRNRDWNALCNLSLAAGDRATAAEALSHIGTNWDPIVWKEKKYFDAAVAWIRTQ
jgi:hypothetical protein